MTVNHSGIVCACAESLAEELMNAPAHSRGCSSHCQSCPQLSLGLSLTQATVPSPGAGSHPGHQALPCSRWFTAAQSSVWNQYLTSANIRAQMAGPRDIVGDCILIM